MPGEQILVVEDNKTTASIMQLKLQSLGYKVPFLAKNADEAIQQVEKSHPSLVLMDINLGKGADGIEAASIIKTRFKTPIVFVTRYNDDATLARAKNIHPLGYINKPLRDKDIRSTVEIAMEQVRHNAKNQQHEQVEQATELKVEFICDAKGRIIDFDPVPMFETLKTLELDEPEQLLPLNHIQVSSYCQRLDSSNLIAGRIFDHIFTWEYIPDKHNDQIKIICENISNKDRLSARHTMEDAFKQTLNYLSTGVILINEQMEPTFINDTAKTLVNATNLINLSNKQLTLTDVDLQNQLILLVQESKDGKITLTDGSVDTTIYLLISPLQNSLNSRSNSAPISIIFLFSGRKDQAQLETVLEYLYGMTKAESRLAAALMRDPRLEQAASSIGITVNTARTHLKKLFSKTGTDRQSSLVHHIVSGPAGVLIKSGSVASD